MVISTNICGDVTKDDPELKTKRDLLKSIP
jgi:hypothetical protein